MNNNYELPDVPNEVFEAAEKQKALQEAINQDNIEKATKAMEALNASKTVNFTRIKNNDDILENPTNSKIPEKAFEKIDFEKVNINGKEMMLSKKVLKDINFLEAEKQCKLAGGRLPTIEEYKAMSNDPTIIARLKDLVLFSSQEYMGDVRVFNFNTGKEEIRAKDQAIETAVAVADIN